MTGTFRRVFICFLGAVAALGMPAQSDYTAEIEEWRTSREKSLTADDGWLTIAGLHFLDEGKNSFGTSPESDIVLRAGPSRAGVITLRDGIVEARAPRDETLSVNGRDVAAVRLWSGPEADRPVIHIGPLSLFCHLSGDRLAIRVRDRESDSRRDFTGLRWFPADASYRVRARYVPHERQRLMKLPNNLGDIFTVPSKGSVAFTLRGKELRLTAIEFEGELWLIFRDLTAGIHTYPAARYVYADAPDKDGNTVVDFNKAYNPPCVYNPYTTCPMPPPENRLPVRIEAGELDYRPGDRE